MTEIRVPESFWGSFERVVTVTARQRGSVKIRSYGKRERRRKESGGVPWVFFFLMVVRVA